LEKRSAGIWLAIFGALLIIAGLGYWRIDQADQNQIKAAVSAYLNMSDVYKAILKETKAVTRKSSMDEQDKLVNERVLEAYRKILTGKILKSYQATLQSYSIFSDDYPMLFSDLERIKIKKMQMTREGWNKYVCRVSLVSHENYSTDLYTPDLNSLITDYRVANFTQAKFNAVANRCNGISLEVNRKNTFKLIKTAQGWLIFDIKYDIEKSKLRLE
jgi:hypothetical protein